MSAVTTLSLAKPHPLLKEVMRLQRLVEDRGAEIRDLRRVLSIEFEAPKAWGLTRRETQVFATLLACEVVTKERLHFAIYGGDSEIDPGFGAIESYVCKLRRKTKRFGVRVVNRRYVGYTLLDRPRYLGGAR